MYNKDLFYDDIKQYIELYNRGLKKNANKVIYQAMINFDILDIDIKKGIVCDICTVLCDKQEEKDLSVLMLRGNGDMPFELGKRVSPILKGYCDDNVMPHMRWYYQLYRDAEVLKKAYNHSECDEYTVNLYFNTFINDLYWGAHHFPDGCLITYQVYTQTVSECYNVISKHIVSTQLLNDFRYYKKLYEVWWEYCSQCEHCEQGKKDVDIFYKLCDKAGVDFTPITAVYYK